MIGYGFEVDVDYTPYQKVHPQNKQELLDYAMKLDMAKEVAMIQRTEKGKMARQYFIETEKKYRKMVAQPPTTLEALQSMINSMVEQERKTRELESKVIHIQDHLTKSPDRKTIERDINTYARRNNMKVQDVRMMVYNKIEDLHGIDIMQRVQNRRDKIQEEKIKRTGSPYAESTLNGKVNGMDIIVLWN